MKVLLIEDDPTIIESVKITLQLRWSEVNLISTFLGEKGIQLARQEHLDLVILGRELANMDSREYVIRAAREELNLVRPGETIIEFK